MVSTRQASDDINLGIRQPEPLEKRARSSSPVKQRRPIQDWTSLTRSADGSLDRLFSTTSLSHEELIRFSKSQISEKLHISKSDYAIPIPFQIQFPPRLTAPPSPQASKKSPKLVFTGHAYEPVAPESPLSPTPDNSFHIARPLSPEKPPSVITSRKKVSAFVKQSHADHLDQLSMIEEKSNTSNSRSSSSDLKSLPPVPPKLEPVLKLPHKEDENVNRTNPDAVLLNSEVRAPLPRKPPPSGDQTTKGSSAAANTKGSMDSFGKKLFAEASRPAQPHKSQATDKGATGFSNTINPSSTGDTAPSRLTHSSAFQHNLNVANAGELKIGKRTFSDESQVSSVSSMNSFGDILNFEHIYMLSPNAKGEVRVSKYVTDMLGDAKAKERSASPPVFLSNNGKIDEQPAALHNPVEPTPSRNHEKETDIVNLSVEYETQPLRTATSKSTVTPEETVHEPTLAPNDNEAEEQLPDDNIGAGFGFHFPNNNSNSTNSNEAKSKLRAQTHRRRRSSRNSFFSDGKIEIPDLNDEHFWQGRLQEKSDWSLKELEPISALNVHTKKHSKPIADDFSADSDSDSSFNSQFSKLQTEKKPTSHMPPSKSSASLSSSLSPVRHARHRSMYNIDFDYQSLAAPMPQHARSKSNATVGETARSFDVLNLAKASRSLKKSNSDNRGAAAVSSSMKDRTSKKLSAVNDSENLKIHVNEPPKRVTYAVDFKTGDAVPDLVPSFHIQRPSQEFYQNLPYQQTPRSNPLSEKYTPESSDAGSSYKSSKTGRDTASTAPTEADNVMIDLTKENYDVHMVSRNDSTTSYRSTIEKTKDGKNVEVVLVEEDGDEEYPDASYNDDRDDLLSIYSRYMTSWDGQRRVRDRDQYFEPTNKSLSRKLSTNSDVSNGSEALGHSWTASETNFQVKSLASIRREQAYQRKPTPTAPKVSSGPCMGKLASPKHVTNVHRDNSYFDYTLNDSYDFKSYMSQQVHK